MRQVPGIETIISPVGLPSSKGDTLLGREFGERFEELKRDFNAAGMALLPYCLSCKAPLVWTVDDDSSTKKGDVFFSCPRCERRWVRGWESKQGIPYTGILESAQRGLLEDSPPLAECQRQHDRAMEIMREREQQYHSSWISEGFDGLAYNLRRKFRRLWHRLVERRELPTEEDTLDLANYAIMLQALAVLRPGWMKSFGKLSLGDEDEET